jgi:hypothetical protein
MNTALRSLTALALTSTLIGSFAWAAAPAGQVDFTALTPSEKGQYVEVNLSSSLIKFAARLAEKQEPEVAALLGNIQNVRVNVVGLDDKNRAGSLAQIEKVRAQLDSGGWTKVVTVREKNGGDNVDVHVKQANDDVIEGLVVTVVSRKSEAVFVNIVGNISAEKISRIAEKLNLEPLRKLKLSPAAKS